MTATRAPRSLPYEHAFQPLPVALSHRSSAELALVAIESSESARGLEVVALDTRSSSDVADFVVIASGRSDRQVQGMANRYLEALTLRGIHPISVEGYDKGHWILIDTGDVVAHFFYESTRSTYDLEALHPSAVVLTRHALVQLCDADRALVAA